MDIQIRSSGESYGMRDRNMGLVHILIVFRAMNLHERGLEKRRSVETEPWHVPISEVTK